MEKIRDLVSDKDIDKLIIYKAKLRCFTYKGEYKCIGDFNIFNKKFYELTMY